MPDTSPSLDILRRLGLNMPNAGAPIDTNLQDSIARKAQVGQPLWKTYGQNALDAVVEGTKGLFGMQANPDTSNTGYVANAATNIFGAVDPILKAGMPLGMIRGMTEEEPQIMRTINNLRTNASGESMASMEALNRGRSMANKGEQFAVFDRGGNMRPLIGPEAVDYKARPGETYGVHTPTGFRVLENKGGLVKAYSGK